MESVALYLFLFINQPNIKIMNWTIVFYILLYMVGYVFTLYKITDGYIFHQKVQDIKWTEWLAIVFFYIVWSIVLGYVIVKSIINIFTKRWEEI